LENDSVPKRLTIFILLVAALMGLLLARLAYLQIVSGEKYSRIANYNIIHTTYLPAPRGEIRDRNGRVLAWDVPRLNVCAVPSEVTDLNIFTKRLAPLIDYTPGRIRKILERKGINPFQKVIIKAKVDTETMMKVAEIQGDMPGLYLEVQPVREYPEKDLASHIIGYVGEITEEELAAQKKQGYLMGDYVGKDGIEKQYDSYLKGEHGENQVLVDASGKAIQTLMEKKSRPGRNLVLTIDAELQKEVEEILAWHVRSLSIVSREPLAASAIIENVNTGEILAMASIPQFDPNLFSKGISVKDYNSLIGRRDYPLLNRSIAGIYPLASTFKMVTASAALQEGICTRYSPFICPGYYQVGNQRFNCFVKSGHGRIDFNDAISESCDVAFYYMGEHLGIDLLGKYAKDFGLGERTGIDLPGEAAGVMPDSFWKMSHIREPWYTGDTINLSIGQGYLGATPVQLSVITAAVANDGKIVRPRLLKSVVDSSGRTIMSEKTKVMRQLKVKRGHFDAIRDGMRTAVLKGTANRLGSKVSASGKTGTAESFPCPENPHGRNHNWFAGFAPASQPDIAVVVIFERSGGYAGKNVVPLSGEILNAYFRRYPPH
jgi:penicillin-binding protein 2